MKQQSTERAALWDIFVSTHSLSSMNEVNTSFCLGKQIKGLASCQTLRTFSSWLEGRPYLPCTVGYTCCGDVGALGTAPIPPLHVFALTNHMTCKIHIEQPKGEGLACKITREISLSWVILVTAYGAPNYTLLIKPAGLHLWVVWCSSYPGWLVPAAALGRMLQLWHSACFKRGQTHPALAFLGISTFLKKALRK